MALLAALALLLESARGQWPADYGACWGSSGSGGARDHGPPGRPRAPPGECPWTVASGLRRVLGKFGQWRSPRSWPSWPPSRSSWRVPVDSGQRTTARAGEVRAVEEPAIMALLAALALLLESARGQWPA